MDTDWSPFLCHFIIINPETTRTELENIIRQTFDADTLQQLDDFQGDINQPDNLRTDRISQLMKTRRGNGRELRMGKEAQETLIKQINARFGEVGI